MKRIRKPIDKEIHSAVGHTTRRKVHHNTSKEKSAVQAFQSQSLIDVHSQSIEWHAPSVTLSLRDRASQLILSDDQMTCKGVEVKTPIWNSYFPLWNDCTVPRILDVSNTNIWWKRITILQGGYRMIRATHGVHNGAYYWECQIGKSTDSNAHVRVGWSTRQGELQAPVGYDRFSFAYRDISGE